MPYEDESQSVVTADGMHLLSGLRIAVISEDIVRAMRLEAELLRHNSDVYIGKGVDDLQAAYDADVQAILVDSALAEGLSIHQAIREDARLRWAKVQRFHWDALWPNPEAGPDLLALAGMVVSVVQPEREFRELLKREPALMVELNWLGPGRILRCIREGGQWRIVYASDTAEVTIEVHDGEITHAAWDEFGPPTARLEGARAVEGFLALQTGRVRVESPEADPRDAILTLRKRGGVSGPFRRVDPDELPAHKEETRPRSPSPELLAKGNDDQGATEVARPAKDRFADTMISPTPIPVEMPRPTLPLGRSRLPAMPKRIKRAVMSAPVDAVERADHPGSPTKPRGITRPELRAVEGNPTAPYGFDRPEELEVRNTDTVRDLPAPDVDESVKDALRFSNAGEGEDYSRTTEQMDRGPIEAALRAADRSVVQLPAPVPSVAPLPPAEELVGYPVEAREAKTEEFSSVVSKELTAMASKELEAIKSRQMAVVAAEELARDAGPEAVAPQADGEPRNANTEEFRVVVSKELTAVASRELSTFRTGQMAVVPQEDAHKPPVPSVVSIKVISTYPVADVAQEAPPVVSSEVQRVAEPVVEPAAPAGAEPIVGEPTRPEGWVVPSPSIDPALLAPEVVVEARPAFGPKSELEEKLRKSPDVEYDDYASSTEDPPRLNDLVSSEWTPIVTRGPQPKKQKSHLWVWITAAFLFFLGLAGGAAALLVLLR